MSYASALFPFGALLRKVSIDALARAADRAPSREQIAAGNAKLGHLNISGLDISIENPEGSTRTDQNNDPPKWSQRITDAHYGYVKGTLGSDGDHVDVFVKPGTQHDYLGPVFVVDQYNAKGEFDEHKCLIGYADKQEAVAAYRANYPKGFKLGPVTELTFDAFKAWLANGDTTRNLARVMLTTFNKVLHKFNPNHDERGRFSDGDGTNGPSNESDRAASQSATGATTQGLHVGSGLPGSTGRLELQSSTPTAVESNTKPLDGLPTHVVVDGKALVIGPFVPAREAAAAYMATTGRAYNPPTQYIKVDPDKATNIANAYDAMRHDPNDPEVRASYQAMIKETVAQYQFIKATGLKIDFIDYAKTGDPYAKSPRLATEDVRNNNHLWVFPTSAGFGSSEAFDSGNNPLLAKTDEYIGGHQLLANDVFRIVHDYFGHVKEGNGFRADGEDNAWRSHVAIYSPLAARAMTTETRGQNSWVNYGPQGEHNRNAGSGSTVFADQKTGLLPEWAMKLLRAFLRKYNDDESRDAHGRWTTGGASSIEYDAKSKTWSKGNGKPLSAKDHARLLEAKVPPGWHDVHLNPDPKGALQVVGRDDKERLQSRYSAEHSAKAAAEKFARLKDFNTALPKIREAIGRDLKKSDEAAVLAIIDKTGFRVGSTDDTGGKVKAYGISTLEGQHVTVSGDKVALSFIGKAGKLNEQSFSDHSIAARIKDIGAKTGERLFATDDEKIRNYLHTISGDQFKTKDFRTWHGTATALDAIKRATPEVSEKDFIRLQKDVSREVAAHLGNTPSVALKYYIDPAVWHKWSPTK